MYNFPHSGKSLEECLQLVNDAAAKNKVSPGTLLWGIESLRDSREDMKSYFDAYVEIVKESIQKAIERGDKGPGVERVRDGYPIKHEATDCAIIHLRSTINHYNTREIHDKWNAAIPMLETSGHCSTMF